MTKTPRVRLVVAIIAAAWVALFAMYLIPVTPAGSTTTSGIAVTPRTVLIGDVPTTVYIGSFTGNRAVLQFRADARNSTALFADLARGQLISGGDEVSPVASSGGGTGSARTLTLTFFSNDPLGVADYRVVISGVRYSFRCDWLNA